MVFGHQWFLGISLTLVLGAAACNELAESPSPAIQTSMICPFEGTEFVVQVHPVEDHDQVEPDLLSQVITIFAQRMGDLGGQEAAIFPESADQIRVQMPIDVDPEQAARLLNNRGDLSFRLQQGNDNTLPALTNLMVEQQSIPEGDEAALQRNREEIAALFEASPQLTGSQLSDAQAQSVSNGPYWEILIEFNQQGTQEFADLTRQVAGTGRSVGIFINGNLVSAPVVDAAYAETGITGGKAVISGSFTAEQANDLALQLRSGAVPTLTEVIDAQATARDANCELNTLG